MEDILSQLLEELPHNRYDIVSKHIFGTFTEDLLRALTKIPGLKFLEQLETELPTVEIRRMDVLAKTLISIPAKTPCFSLRDVGGHGA